MEWLRKVWKDAVFSKVIATGITAGGALLIVWFVAVTPSLTRWLRNSVSLPRWVFWVWVIISAVAAVRLTVSLIADLLATPDVGPSDYKSDVIDDIRWRWNTTTAGEIYDLATFCERCDYQLSSSDVISDDGYPHAIYRAHCPNCSEAAIIGHLDKLQSMESNALRVAQLKLRNGTWRQVVASQRR